MAGGGTDMPSFYAKQAGAVVSFTINKYVYVSVNDKFDGKFRISYSETENVDLMDEIRHDLVRNVLISHKIDKGLEITSVADVPGSGSGLGSSSAFTVGLLKCLQPSIDASVLAEKAFYVESEMCHHVLGKQDQYACAHGGFNFITFGRSVSVKNFLPSLAWQNEFEKHCLLLYTGITRENNSTSILEKQNRMFQNGENSKIGMKMAELAHQLYGVIFESSDIYDIGVIMNEGWELKRSLVKGISDSAIDLMYDKAILSGAWGGKLLGAGAGGFLFFVAPPNLHKSIITQTGLQRVPFEIELEGSKVIYDNVNPKALPRGIE